MLRTGACRHLLGSPTTQFFATVSASVINSKYCCPFGVFQNYPTYNTCVPYYGTCILVSTMLTQRTGAQNGLLPVYYNSTLDVIFFSLKSASTNNAFTEEPGTSSSARVADSTVVCLPFKVTKSSKNSFYRSQYHQALNNT